MKALIIFALVLGISNISAKAQDDPARQDEQTLQSQPVQQSVAPRHDRNTRPQWQQRGHRDRFPGTEVDTRPDGDVLHDDGNMGGAKKGNRFSSFVSNINACDVDYGNRLDAWHREIVGDTLRNLFWWITVIETSVLALMLFYLMYLFRERKQRHRHGSNPRVSIRQR